MGLSALQLVLAPAAAFGVAFGTLAWMLRSRWAARVRDIPNERSLHTAPVPRTGGLGVLAGTAVGWLAAGAASLSALLVPLALLAAVSFLDDLRPLSAQLRLAVHLATGAVFLWLCPGLTGGLLLAGLFVLALAWFMNLYNFMDGSDGLAAGMTISGFGFMAAAAWMGGGSEVAAACAAVSAAALAFLPFNFHPARMFLGDVGSVPLGFLAGALGLLGWRDGLWPLWFPVLVFSPFIVDATVTLARRALRGERVWQAHREHYYQRLVRLGLGHRGTALVEYALMATVGLLALWGLDQGAIGQMLVLAAAGVLYLVTMAGVDMAWNRAHGKRNAGT